MKIRNIGVIVFALAMSLSSTVFANTRYVCHGKKIKFTAYNSADFFNKEKFVLVIANYLDVPNSSMGNLVGPVVLKGSGGVNVETVNQLPSFGVVSGLEIWDKTFTFNMSTNTFTLKKGREIVVQDKNMVCSFR